MKSVQITRLISCLDNYERCTQTSYLPDSPLALPHLLPTWLQASGSWQPEIVLVGLWTWRTSWLASSSMESWPQQHLHHSNTDEHTAVGFPNTLASWWLILVGFEHYVTINVNTKTFFLTGVHWCNVILNNKAQESSRFHHQVSDTTCSLWNSH